MVRRKELKEKILLITALIAVGVMGFEEFLVLTNPELSKETAITIIIVMAIVAMISLLWSDKIRQEVMAIKWEQAMSRKRNNGTEDILFMTNEEISSLFEGKSEERGADNE